LPRRDRGTPFLRLADVGLGEVLAQIGPEIVVSPMATEYK
jgi:hypothetical protein